MADWIPRADTVLGRIARLPLALVPDGRPVPILRGSSRGLRWIAGSGPHSCWLGINEIRKRRLFGRAVRPGDIVYDIGAHVGSYTLEAAVLVGPEGRVVAFEPCPANVAFLRQHVTINGLVNVTIVERAVSNHVGTVRFRPTPDRVTSTIDPEGPVQVPCLTVDDFVRRHPRHPPDALKIDVEGAEVDVLTGARSTLDEFAPWCFVATHGGDTGSACRSLLQDLGYGVSHVPGHPDELVARPPRT